MEQRNVDSGIMCLVLLAQLHDVMLEYNQIAHQLNFTDRANEVELCRIAKSYDLRSSIINVKIDRLSKTPLPVIAKDINGDFFLITKVTENAVLTYNRHGSKALYTHP